MKYQYKIPVKKYIKLYDLIMDNNYHTLIAGATGSGKSVLLNSSIIYEMNNNTPASVQFVFFDPKKIELIQYKNTRYCLKFCTEINDILYTMEQLRNTMEARYNKMIKAGERFSSDKKIIVVIDELADLLTGYDKKSKKFENLLIVMLQKCRAANIKFIVATQQPARSILKNSITLNLTNRVALRTTSAIESRQIINAAGAETLPKYGFCIVNSPEYMQPQKFEISLTPDQLIQESCKAWSAGGYMVIK
ncbi:MAG: DUF2075 domain-containing protein [Lachnospiraceae bacterium]|nr:DUF2075 domain-containing protein [Lachnospiraceae bacterium]